MIMQITQFNFAQRNIYRTEKLFQIRNSGKIIGRIRFIRTIQIFPLDVTLPKTS